MVKAARDDSPTKTKLLDAAQALMLAKGFSATTVEEICEAARLTKGSFFHYFESKEALGRAALQRFCASGQAMHEACCTGETDPLKRVYAYIDGMIHTAGDPKASQGCLLGLFAQELCDTHPDIRAVCRKAFDAWAGHFARELSAAKRHYARSASFRPRELADHLIAIMEGSMILGKARKDMAVLATNLRHFKAYLQGLFEGN